MWIPITTTLFLYLLMTKPEDSSFICGVFISVRILCTSFINVALYISLFCRYILHAHKVASTLSSSRFILVKFSDRALVYNGYPNLKLLNFLFWVVCVTVWASLMEFSHFSSSSEEVFLSRALRDKSEWRLIFDWTKWTPSKGWWHSSLLSGWQCSVWDSVKLSQAMWKGKIWKKRKHSPNLEESTRGTCLLSSRPVGISWCVSALYFLTTLSLSC